MTTYPGDEPVDEMAEVIELTGEPERDNYAVLVGIRAHLIAARVLEAGPLPDDRLACTQLLLGTGRDVLAEHKVPRRSRAILAEACGSAAAYIHQFAPCLPWRLEGAEVAAGNGRMDLVFAHPDGTHLVDEMKFGFTRFTESHLRPQIDRYLDAGVSMWGTAFAGVRLCAVSSPAHSRFYFPTKRYSVLLTETPYYDLRSTK